MKLALWDLRRGDRVRLIAWISSDYFESLLLPQERGENDSKQSDEFQAIAISGTLIGDRLMEGDCLIQGRLKQLWL